MSSSHNETAVDEVGASAIAYRSWGGRLMQFLSGEISLKLVTDAAVPEIVLPRTASKE